MSVDWRPSVYGAWNGDDELPAPATIYVSDAKLRAKGKSAYSRAYEVISSGRLHSAVSTVTDEGIHLSAQAVSADHTAADYTIDAFIDAQTADIATCSCSCPAFGRFGMMCKHVIAMVMLYNEEPDLFEHRGLATLETPVRQTSRELRTLIRKQSAERKRTMQSRQRSLMQELGRAEQPPDTRSSTNANAPLGSDSRLATGSVSIRPSIEYFSNGWLIRLRVVVADKRITYVVKDIGEFLDAVRHERFVSYGKKLAFDHTSDTFDERSQAIITILECALRIRDSVLSSAGRYVFPFDEPGVGWGQRTGPELKLSDDEIGEILDLFVNAEAGIDFVPYGEYRSSAVAVQVVDGNPNLGLVIRPDDGGSGEDHGDDGGNSDGHADDRDYIIEHTENVERFIISQRSCFVVVRPNSGGVPQLTRIRPTAQGKPVIYRCTTGFARQRDLINVLCSESDSPPLTLAASDVQDFAATILPLLRVPGDSNAPDAIEASLPAEFLALKREPCILEAYLDRDGGGITCDLVARYGEQRHHVIDGIAPNDTSGRDRDAERLAVDVLLHYFPRPEGVTARLDEADEDAIYRFLTEGLPVLRGMAQVYSTPAFDGMSRVSRPTVQLGLSMRSGLVEISAIADEIDPGEVRALLASYRKRRRFHRLGNGAFVDVASMDLSGIDDVAKDLGFEPSALAQGEVSVEPYAAYYLDSQIPDAGKDEGFRRSVNDMRQIDPNTYAVPDALAGVLRPYQIEGFRWLGMVADRGFGGILADEMGLGKTVELLAFLQARCGFSRGEGHGKQRSERRGKRRGNGHDDGPSLIVCPASLVYNWQAECHKFTPDMRVVPVVGTKAQRRDILSQASQYDLLVTSYDLLRRDVDDYASVSFSCLALDEAQYVKNHATKSAKAVRAINARHRFALTGTPIENRLAELWSMFDFLMPGILGSYAHFRERFEMPILAGDESAQARLQAFVAPFILRRLKSQVLDDLPDKIENVLTVQLEGGQRKLYAALEQQLRATINKQDSHDFQTGKIQVLAQLTKLRQVCCDPRLVYEGTQNLASAKLDAIAELVSTCRDEGRKMLIFSQFTSYLDLIAERLKEDGVGYDVITGATSKRRRLELVNQFNSDATPVFLISLKAGNTGLNLTGACVVVHADPWWNAAAQNQATDRAHRIGQLRDVNVYQIVAKDTIEERILNLQRSKSDLAAKFVDSADASGASIASLTKDDLLDLLG